MISPHFAKMEDKYPGVKLVKVDVEEQEVCLVHLHWNRTPSVADLF